MNQSISFRGIEIIRLFEIIDNRSFVSRKARYLSLVETGDNFYFLLDNIVNFLHEFSLDSHSLMIKYCNVNSTLLSRGLKVKLMKSFLIEDCQGDAG